MVVLTDLEAFAWEQIESIQNYKRNVAENQGLLILLKALLSIVLLLGTALKTKAPVSRGLK
jgi:hypothetical protein